MRVLRLSWLMTPLVAVLLLTSCTYIERLPGMEQRPLIWMSLNYDGGATDLTARYSLPPPPAGNVYVVWALTQDHSKTAKVGVIPPGVSEGSVSARVGFRVDGLIVSAEQSPDVNRIGENRGVVDVGFRR